MYVPLAWSLELRTFVVVTVLCLIALVPQLLGASVFPVLSLFAAAWLILVGIGGAIYISGYAIYVLNKQHDNHRVPVGVTSKKAASLEPELESRVGPAYRKPRANA